MSLDLKMSSCVNIAGREIKRRQNFGYIGILLTIMTVFYFLSFEHIYYFRSLVFLPSLLMTVPLLEARSETCIVNAFLGLKNMGERYEKERDSESLKYQKKESIVIILKGILISFLITALMFMT